jgi:cytochrome c-type biogenesis protein CcmH/NrfF
MKKWIYILFLTLLGSWNLRGAAQTLPAEDMTPAQAELFYRVGDNLRCPTCIGLSVLQSEAEFAVQIRKAAKEQVLAGKTEPEIMTFFTTRYGVWILREPPVEGFHLFAWGIPIALGIFGPILMYFFVWRRRKEVSIFGVRPSAEILAEMELELQRLRKAG